MHLRASFYQISPLRGARDTPFLRAFGQNSTHRFLMRRFLNPSLYVVPLGDDGCYIDDRGGGAAADELGEADQAWGIEDSMSSLSRRRSNRCACPPPAPRAHSFSPPIRRPSAHVIASRAHALTRLALFAGNLAVATRPMDPSPSFYIIFWVRPSAPSPKPMPTAPPDHRAPMLPQAAGALL